jgi:hypothetical protein
LQDEERAAAAARERAAGEMRLAAAAQARQLADEQALQAAEARSRAESEALEAALAKTRAESAAALQARRAADVLMRSAQAIIRGARFALALRHGALAAAALGAIVWLGAYLYTASPDASPDASPVLAGYGPAAAAARLPSAPIGASVAESGIRLNLKLANGFQTVPGER